MEKPRASASKVLDSEIEVTPEMNAAGKVAFEAWMDFVDGERAVAFMPSDQSLSLLLSEVYRSMIACSPERVRKSLMSSLT